MAEDATKRPRRRLAVVLDVDLDRAAVIDALRKRLARSRRPQLKLLERAGRLEIRFARQRAPFTDYEVRPVVIRITLTDHGDHTTVVAAVARRWNARELHRFINRTAIHGGTNLFADMVGIPEARARRRRDAIVVLDHVTAALGPHAIARGQSAYRHPARDE